jgi:DnaJ-class molecular chaperone
MDTTLYDRLKLSPNCSDEEIKKAYKLSALIHHPDKNGGNDEKFKEISEAYEILMNPKKRTKYDKYGMKFLQASNEQPTQQIPVPCTLEELYLGGQKEVIYIEEYPCLVCVRCKQCDGRGFVIAIKRMGVMVQQIKVVCPLCNGKPTECNKCNGNGVTKKEIKTKIQITSDMRHGSYIQDDDILFVIQEVQHQIYKKSGDNLICKIKISLLEALSGFTASLKYLDGSILNIKSSMVVKPDTMYKVTGKGVHDGDLLISFDILFPDKIIFGLERMLPSRIHSLSTTENIIDLETYQPETHHSQNSACVQQ